MFEKARIPEDHQCFYEMQWVPNSFFQMLSRQVLHTKAMQKRGRKVRRESSTASLDRTMMTLMGTTS